MGKLAILVCWFAALGNLRAQVPAVPRIVQGVAGNQLELDYTGAKQLLVNKSAKWELDQQASTGLGTLFQLEDEQGNVVSKSTGASRFRLVALGNAQIKGKLVFRHTELGANAPAAQEELAIVREAPYLRVYSPNAKDPNRELSAQNPIEIEEQTDANAFFLKVPLTVKSNVTWDGKLDFPRNLRPWAFFSLTSSQTVSRIETREASINVDIDALNYGTQDDEVDLEFSASTGVAMPNLSTKFKIIRKPLSSQITSVDNNPAFSFKVKPPAPTRELDTIFVPYYLAQANIKLAGNATWGTFNDVELRQKYNLKVAEQAGDKHTGTIEILQPNFTRGNRVVVPLLFHHKGGIKVARPQPWKAAIIVQEPGYLDVEHLEVKEASPGSGQLQIKVWSNLEWTASLVAEAGADNSWITLDNPNHKGDADLLLKINTPNYTGKPRQVQIVLKAKHGPERELIFTQASAYIKIVQPKQAVFPNISTGSIGVKVEANVPWTVDLPPAAKDWLKITDITPDGFALQAQHNTSGNVRYSGVILQSQDGAFPMDKTPEDPQFVQQLLTGLSMQVIPFPRMLFLAPAEQEQTLEIKTSGGWYIEKLPNMDYSWLGFPETLFGNGASKLVFRTTQTHTGKDIRQVTIRVRSQLKDLTHYDVEILQVPEQFVTVNTLVKDQLRVTFSAFRPGYKARVFSEYGVMAQEIVFKNAQEWVDMSILPTGNYLLYFYDKDGTVLAVKKFIKM